MDTYYTPFFKTRPLLKGGLGALRTVAAAPGDPTPAQFVFSSGPQQYIRRWERGVDIKDRQSNPKSCAAL